MAAPKPKEDSKENRLDETQWRSPAFAQSLGGIHTNSIHHYFAASSFFDKMSNNGFLLNQARFNADMYGVVQTREAFEAQLRGMQGIEFMVAFEPSQTESVWVIRKQSRKKREPGAEDSVEVLATYFVVGESIYMAPSVGNVVGTRMLHALTSLTKFLSTASALPIFTPSRGYTYLPPATKPASTTTTSTSGTATFSATQTTKEASTPSRQGYVAPPSSTQPTTTGSGSAISAADRTAYATLAESFSLSLRYYNPTTGQGTDSYMDENPLVGEPGSFILTSTQSKAAAAAAARQSAKTGTGATPSTAGAATAAQQVAAAAKKGAAAGKEKSPTSPVIPGGKPKRRKSKAAGIGTKA